MTAAVGRRADRSPLGRSLVIVSLVLLVSPPALAQDSARGARIPDPPATVDPTDERANPPEASRAGARFSIDETTVDLGTLIQGASLEHIFRIRNLGTETLRIDGARVT